MRPMRLALLIAGSLSVLYIAHPSPHTSRTIATQSLVPYNITPETNQAIAQLAIPKTLPPPPPATERVTPNRATRSTPRRITPPTVRRAPRTVTAPNPGTATNIDGVWACIRLHESGNNYSRNNGNGYYGAYQFSPTTWWATMARLGYGTYVHRVYSGPYPRADLAPPTIQDQAAVNLQAVAGWGQWPQTSRMCGVR
jgi:hypothetical protein